ncbi:hypothetical protein OLCHANIL_00152 [Vibrio phage V05]|nr:hypothetical protein OLCHANIL_00152 [Vibrio phage V05]
MQNNTEIRRVISEKALELRQNTEILSDDDSYTCHILEDHVADTLGEHCRLESMLLIHDLGIAFCKHVRAEPEAVFGRELNPTVLEYIDEILTHKLTAFVHSISRAFGDDDGIEFADVRKAWLKFLINSL